MWSDLKPKTKQTAILVFGAIIITSMITGYFPELVKMMSKAYDLSVDLSHGVK